MNRSLPTLLAAVAMLSCSSEEAPDPELASPTFRTIGSIERIDPAIDAIVPPGTVLEVLADATEVPHRCRRHPLCLLTVICPQV